MKKQTVSVHSMNGLMIQVNPKNSIFEPSACGHIISRAIRLEPSSRHL